MSESDHWQPVPSRRAFLASLAAAFPTTLLLAEEVSWADEKATTFSTDVSVVSVLATVRDKQGKIVASLGKDDFVLSEDDRPQTIRYFARETDLPLTLGLLVDTSASQRRVIGEERTASYRFLDKVLRADKDQTFVIHFDHDTELLQDLTSSRPLLQKALDQLELPDDQRPQLNRRGGGGGYPGGGRYPGGGGGGRRAGTTLYDAIYLASGDLMKKQQGRKALILLTDGVDNGSKTYLNDAIAAAQKSDTLVYSILFADAESYRQPVGGFGGRGMRRGGGMGRRPMEQRPDGKNVLRQISKETGGSFFEVSKKTPIDAIYDKIQEELRNQYNIGYTSDKTDPTPGFRAIKLTTRKQGMVVQARQGYYPAPKP
jgi:VWFA-related protein